MTDWGWSVRFECGSPVKKYHHAALASKSRLSSLKLGIFDIPLQLWACQVLCVKGQSLPGQLASAPASALWKAPLWASEGNTGASKTAALPATLCKSGGLSSRPDGCFLKCTERFPVCLAFDPSCKLRGYPFQILACIRVKSVSHSSHHISFWAVLNCRLAQYSCWNLGDVTSTAL